MESGGIIAVRGHCASAQVNDEGRGGAVAVAVPISAHLLEKQRSVMPVELEEVAAAAAVDRDKPDGAGPRQYVQGSVAEAAAASTVSGARAQCMTTRA